MRDPAAYLLLLSIIVILLIDNFLFNGYILNVIGKFVAGWTNWLVGLFGG